jgi:hypothetical protein
MRAVWCRIAPCKPLAWVPRLNLKHRALAGAVLALTVAVQDQQCLCGATDDT